MDNQDVSIIKENGKLYEVVVAKNPVERKQILDAIDRNAEGRKGLVSQLEQNAEIAKHLDVELKQFDELSPPVKPNRLLRRKKV